MSSAIGSSPASKSRLTGIEEEIAPTSDLYWRRLKPIQDGKVWVQRPKVDVEKVFCSIGISDVPDCQVELTLEH
jgi:hypothetical protein